MGKTRDKATKRAEKGIELFVTVSVISDHCQLPLSACQPVSQVGKIDQSCFLILDIR